MDPDIKIFDRMYNFYKWHGMAPLYPNEANSFQGKLYNVFVISFIILLGVVNGYNDARRFQLSVGELTAVIQDVIAFGSMQIHFLKVLICRKKWKAFFKGLEYLTCNVRHQSNKKLYLIGIQVFTFFLPLLNFLCSLYITPFDVIPLLFQRVPIYIVDKFYFPYAVSQIVTTLYIISQRYDEMTTHISRISLDDPAAALQKLFHFRKLIVRGYVIVKIFNYLLGWPMLLSVFASTVKMTGYVSHIKITSSFHKSIVEFAIFSFFSMSSYVSNIILLIAFCDKLEKSGQRFIHKCNELQTTLPDSALRDELIFLSEIAKYMAPKWSAAGFFTVNSGFFASYFSGIITYTVITIQFAY
uniref:Gustatory receptor n=1 Tax=Diabrotica virgifera virgifera TaxID=50390 RepID=A0A6P7G1H9_DIAVI